MKTELKFTCRFCGHEYILRHNHIKMGAYLTEGYFHHEVKQHSVKCHIEYAAKLRGLNQKVKEMIHEKIKGETNAK